MPAGIWKISLTIAGKKLFLIPQFKLNSNNFTDMENFRNKLRIVNQVLEKYKVDPITEYDIMQTLKELQSPDNSKDYEKSFKELWQRIQEYEDSQVLI